MLWWLIREKEVFQFFNDILSSNERQTWHDWKIQWYPRPFIVIAICHCGIDLRFCRVGFALNFFGQSLQARSDRSEVAVMYRLEARNLAMVCILRDD